MEMIVDPQSLARLLAASPASGLQEGGERHALLSRLAHEVLNYGAEVLPAPIFQSTSGREIAAMVCEDIEGAQQILPLIAPRPLDAPPIEAAASDAPDAAIDSGEGESGDDEGDTVEPLRRPRIVHVSDGWGFPSLVLATLEPEQRFEVIETDVGRAWLWKRLSRVFSVRNLDLIEVRDLEAWAMENRESVDMLLVKHRTPHQALELGLPLLAPGGRILSWQRGDRSNEVRRPMTDARGGRVRLQRNFEFESAVARPRTLLCVGGEDAATPMRPAAMA